MKPLVAIPCFGAWSDAARRALLAVVDTVRAAGCADVYVFHPPGRAPSLPDGVAARALAPGAQPPSAFPAGWADAARALAALHPGRAVLVVRPDNPGLTAGRVAEAAAILERGEFSALASVTPSEDHPCQWEEFFDVLAGRLYAPVDTRAHEAAARVARAVGAPGRVVVSRPLVMPPSAPWPRGDASAGVLEWLPEEGVLLGSPRGACEAGPPSKGRVFLYREHGPVVRQAVYSDADLAALPLFAPVARAEAVFLRAGANWEILLASGMKTVRHVQVFGLPGPEAPEGEGDPSRLTAVRPGRSLGVEGRGFVSVGHIPALVRSTLAVCDVLAPADLPRADIAIPFETPGGGWRRDVWTMAMRNTATGELVLGRQCFPEVYEPEGSLLGLGGDALSDLDAFLARGGEVFPLVIGAEERFSASAPACLAPRVPGDARDEAEGGPELGDFEHPLLRGFLDAWSDLEAALDRAREDLSDAGRAVGAAPPPTLIRATELAVEVCERQAALTLEKDALAEAVNAHSGRAYGLLPLRTYHFHQSRALGRSEEFLGEEARESLGEELFDLWTLASGGDPAAGYAALSARAARLGLSPVWSAGAPLALARRDLYEQARELAAKRYAAGPWLRDEHARIAVTCLRSTSRFDDYLDWIERDAAPGRMSPLWMPHLCEALAVCRREREASRLADAVYARDPSAANFNAIIAWWRFTIRDFLPEEALKGFEKDAALHKRLTGEFAGQHAQMLAANGEVDRACAVVERLYAKDMGAGDAYAMVGWFAYMVHARDPGAALAMAGRDRELGRLDKAFLGFEAALAAFTGRRDEALDLVERLYDENSAYAGWFANVGLMLWLHGGDADAALECFARDAALGRLPGLDVRVLYLALLHRAGLGDSPLAEELLAAMPRNEIAWDVGVARLKWLGYREDEVARLMTPGMRALLLDAGRA